MLHNFSKNVLVSVTAYFLASCSQTVYIGELEGGTLVSKRNYEVIAPLPEGIFKNIRWSAFKETKEPENTTLNIGAGPHSQYSWVASVYMDRTKWIKSSKEYVEEYLPEEKYSHFEKQTGISCSKGGPFVAFENGRKTYNDYVMICFDNDKKLKYEVIFSEKNIWDKAPKAEFTRAADEFFASFKIR